MTAERDNSPQFYHPDGNVAPHHMPAQILVRTSKSLGRFPDKVFASLTELRKYKDIYPAVKRFQDAGNNVFLQANAHKGVILIAMAIGTGTAAGILVKRSREKRKSK